MGYATHNVTFAPSGIRHVAAGVVKQAYTDYWRAYKSDRKCREKLEKCKSLIEAEKLRRRIRLDVGEMAEIESFFASEYYKDVLTELAPTLTVCSFKEFKDSLPQRYEEAKHGRPAFTKWFEFVNEEEY